MLLSNLTDLAIRAHNWTSFDPEKRGANLVKEFSTELSGDLQTIRNFAAKYQAEDKLDAALDRYEEKYRNYFTGWVYAKSRCFSAMITGPAKFPVRRHEKANNAERGHYEKFREWREKALKGIEKSFKPEVTVDGELSRYEKKLAELQKLQEAMKAANIIIRKAAPTMVDQLLALGFSPESVRSLITPDFMNRVGFPPYRLQNNLAMIKDTERRLGAMRQRKQAITATGESSEVTIGEVRVVFNTAADRIQLLYQGKPDAETIGKLKSNAFRWSPSNKAWQRNLNTAGRWAAERVLGCELPLK